MPRTLRVLLPGAWYHVTARGIERRAIYEDDRDRAHFVELLEEMVSRFGLRLHAFVLMENHYHLLLELGLPNLSRALQWLNLSYSVWFNRRHRRTGYLFQGRFKSVVVDPRGWGLRLSAYLHLNPVRVSALALGKRNRQGARAGVGTLPAMELVRERLVRLRKYRWSSYRAYIGLSKRPAWLETATVLNLGGGPSAQRIARYRKYVEAQVREGMPLKPWEEVLDRVVLGSAEFLTDLKAQMHRGSAEAAPPRWLREPVALETVIAAVEKVRGQRWDDIKERHGDRGRDLVLYLARKATGLTVSALAQAVGLKQHANVSMSVKRYEQALQTDTAERKRAAAAAKMLHVTL